MSDYQLKYWALITTCMEISEDITAVEAPSFSNTLSKFNQDSLVPWWQARCKKRTNRWTKRWSLRGGNRYSTTSKLEVVLLSHQLYRISHKIEWKVVS